MESDQTTGWSNADFHAKLAVETTPASGWNSTNDCRLATNSGPCHLQDMIDSYVEERNWGIYYAHEALFDHPLRAEVGAALEELRPRRPDVSAGGWQQVSDLAARFELGRWSIGFNQTTGSINHLLDRSVGAKARGRVWADRSHQLAEYTYQTYTAHDHNFVFMDEYMSEAQYNPTMGASLNGDFGKPGLSGTEHLDLRASLLGLWMAPNSSCSNSSSFVRGGCHQFALHLGMDAHAHTMYGAPHELWVRVDVPDAGARFGITVDMFNKTSTRLIESSSVRFVPAPLASPTDTLTMQVSKLGSWVDPADVALNGSRHLHGLDDRGGVGLFASDRTLTARVITVDGTTSCVGRYPTPYPTPLNEAFDPGAGFAANIHNNVWNTCYILFYPYLAEDRDLRQRYVLDLDAAAARSLLPWQAGSSSDESAAPRQPADGGTLRENPAASAARQLFKTDDASPRSSAAAVPNATVVTHADSDGARTVSLRAGGSAVTFCETPAGFLLCSSEVFVPSARQWAVLFDVPSPIVAGKVWDLRPSAFVVTRNDSGVCCVNLTGSQTTGRGAFWIESCVDGQTGQVSFEAALDVVAGTALDVGRPEPQLVLRRSTPAGISVQQGPLSIYSDHDPSDPDREDKTAAAAPCSGTAAGGALGHGVGMPAAFGQWDLDVSSSDHAGGRVGAGTWKAEAAVFFNFR
eukprot:SAG11_NODE_42_length_20827_cov_9.289801_6_plen_690_part_00